MEDFSSKWDKKIEVWKQMARKVPVSQIVGIVDRGERTIRAWKKELFDLSPELVQTLPAEVQALYEKETGKELEELGRSPEVSEGDHRELDRHRVDILELAQRVRAELHLPATWYSFIEDFGPGTHPYLDQVDARLQYLWEVMEDGHTVRLLSPVEADKEVEHLLRGLFSHLATSEFSNVVKSYEERTAKGGQYLDMCYGLLLVVKGDVEGKNGVAFVERLYGKNGVAFGERLDGESFGVTQRFVVGICADAVATAKGSPRTTDFEYNRECLPNGNHALRFGAGPIAFSASEDKLEGYEKMHKELREKYVQCEISKEIAKLSEEIRKLESSISSELQKFAMTVPLPGYCDLCKKAQGLG